MPGTVAFETSSQSKTSTDIDASSFDRFVAIDQTVGTRNWALAGKTGYFNAPPGTSVLSMPSNPGADMVVDPLSGRSLGVSDASGEIRLPDMPKLERSLASMINEDTADGRLVLRNLSVDPRSQMGVIGYLADAQSRAFRILKWNPKGRVLQSRVLTCATKPVLNRPNLAIVTTHFIQLGVASRPLPAIWYSSSNRARTLVVYLAGGPLAPRFSSAETSRTFRYLASGADVLAPAFSGGTNLGQDGRIRLSNSPVQALTHDNVELARYLEVEAAHYENIIIHAESFAAGAALDLARQLESRKVQMVLTSPWLSYVPPTAYTQEATRFERFETVQIGLRTSDDRDAYFAWIARNLRARRAENTLIVYGGRDRRIGQSAIATARQEGLATVVEVPFATHEVAQISPQTWGAIDSFVKP